MNQNSFSENSEIIITKFSDELKSELETFYSNSEINWFNFDSLLVDSVRAIIEESYQSGDRERRIIIESKRINSISQNALLKVLEEPPKGVNFTIIVPSKSILLPTIRSRLPLKVVEGKREATPNIEFPDLFRFDLIALNRVLNQVKKLEKRDAQITIELILQKNISYPFSQDDLERFSIASQLISLGTNIGRVYLMFLLPFANRNR